jgi:hypothetical protein
VFPLGADLFGFSIYKLPNVANKKIAVSIAFHGLGKLTAGLKK